MKQFQKLFLRKAPGFVKGKMIRNKVNIPKNPAKDFVFKIATQPDELEQVYELLYKAYLEKGFVNEKPCKMHLTPFHGHPLAVTFVGKYGDEVAITISLFPDSELGLPMDDLYKKELDKLRKQGRFIAEVGSLASSPKFRTGSQLLPLMMNNIMHRYAKEHLRVEDLVITVNPAHEFVYRHIVFFKRMGKVKPYDTVNGHLAVPLRLNLHTAHAILKTKTDHLAPNKNLYDFFYKNHYKNVILPSDNKIVQVFNKRLYNQFFSHDNQLDYFVSGKQHLILFELYDKFEALLEPISIEELSEIVSQPKVLNENPN
ncbi:MAG: hypothetical protein AAF348_15600 [Bacteroidota bacterium]